MKILVAVVGVVVLALAGALGYMGAFSSVKVEERDAGPYPFVYVQEASADPGRVRELTEELGARLEKAGYTSRRPAQVYYPVGRGIQNQIGFVVDRPVTLDVLGATTFFRPIPVERYMAASFPFRNPLSFAVAYPKVEAALAGYRKGKGYAETAVMVILEGDSILYLQRIEKG